MEKRLLKASRKGHIDRVKELLKVPGINVNHAGKDGKTPLMLSSENGHVEIVKELLAFPGINFLRDGGTALQMASRNKHIECVKELLKVFPSIDVNHADKNGDKVLDFTSLKDYYMKVKNSLRCCDNPLPQ